LGFPISSFSVPHPPKQDVPKTARNGKHLRKNTFLQSRAILDNKAHQPGEDGAGTLTGKQGPLTFIEVVRLELLLLRVPALLCSSSCFRPPHRKDDKRRRNTQKTIGDSRQTTSKQLFPTLLIAFNCRIRIETRSYLEFHALCEGKEVQNKEKCK
jgi:hypothetical protein